MSLTDCFMSAFIGLCRALSQSPRQCVGVCTRQYVYVQGKKRKWCCMAIIAAMFGYRASSAGCTHISLKLQRDGLFSPCLSLKPVILLNKRQTSLKPSRFCISLCSKSVSLRLVMDCRRYKVANVQGNRNGQKMCWMGSHCSEKGKSAVIYNASSGAKIG